MTAASISTASTPRVDQRCVPPLVRVVERCREDDDRPDAHRLARAPWPRGRRRARAPSRRSGSAARRRRSAARCRPPGPRSARRSGRRAARSGWRPPHVPTRRKRLTPSWTSSSITIAAVGQPMPVACTETGLALVRRPCSRAARARRSAARRRRGTSRRCTSRGAGRREAGTPPRSRRARLGRESARRAAYCEDSPPC